MKKSVQKISQEIMKKEFPIESQISGWFFRKREISNGAWEVEGTDQWGRRVYRVGDDPEKLISQCIIDAKRINESIERT